MLDTRRGGGASAEAPLEGSRWGLKGLRPYPGGVSSALRTGGPEVSAYSGAWGKLGGTETVPPTGVLPSSALGAERLLRDVSLVAGFAPLPRRRAAEQETHQSAAGGGFRDGC